MDDKSSLYSAIFDEASTTQSTEPDKIAITEEKNLAKAKNAVAREITHITRIILWVGAALLLSIVITRVWHLCASESLRWLSDSDIQSIDKMLFSSAFGGVMLNYIKSVMDPSKN